VQLGPVHCRVFSGDAESGLRPRGRLHRGAQAERVRAAQRRHLCRGSPRGRLSARRLQHGPWQRGRRRRRSLDPPASGHGLVYGTYKPNMHFVLFT